ncbi:hemagglutinin [Xenorhabdus sp. PB62.4]|uniref:hemagglutinin n=1 Tax=Xenorhabdus sp. PB62.4 TaxID=1851573 RepID=UPI0016576168|nr:hemagglutinin [Xenorhabdus sp. PB62.4]MBC8952385.1 hypothetical protein [Xenorhabdus sp. PB62.4]
MQPKKLTEQNIFAYAESLTGGVPLTRVPSKTDSYIARLVDGSVITLRQFSTSVDKTQARWTIEILRDEQIGNLQGNVKKPVEIKFR